MLISYPFAFLTGAWGFGVAGALAKRDDLTLVARHLVPAGIVAGLAAAIPGIMDYRGSVPPDSSAKERATRHALINSTAMALFAAGWMLGKGGRRTGFRLALQTLGTAALSAGGWLGGTLVYRNQIGVDHRYANSGKWQEDSRAQPGSGALTSAAASLGVDQMKLVHAGDERVVVANTEQGRVAFQDRCTHKGGPLSDGVLICGTVQCPWHGSQFDVTTGAVKCGPAETPIRVYEVNPSRAPA